ncbi:MAG: cell division protein FtsZ [Parvibaculum sp.]|uniref:cell division protein FtsZ n=1 Tax=Parvibaculum sp. TaxID=2024848 RepID=UPI00272F9B2F|nr:cell division protein FtsZ [Parvibaculum sp.]MDP2149774.1 cell division protein FtsZ [Parvibaculum sp.]
MSIEMIEVEEFNLGTQIKVIGVGGGGGNAVEHMIARSVQGVEFICANTDAQSLSRSAAHKTIQLGNTGLGAGSKPDKGREAAEVAVDSIREAIAGAHMLFITAGMGGGTGTGAAPVIARAARENGILTVGVVTKPFQFEGSRRMRLAEEGIRDLQQYVDTLIIIPNQNLFRVANENTTFADAFGMADQVLHSGVAGITDLMMKPGLINLDFADVRTVMNEMGKAMMGTGEASGENRAIEAAEAAISNPLLDEVSMKGAKGVLINITGGMDLTLYEVDEAANRIRSEVDPDANIIVGSTFDNSLDGRMRVSVVATGIEAEAGQMQRPETQPAQVRAVQDRAPAARSAAATFPAVRTLNPVQAQVERIEERLAPATEQAELGIETAEAAPAARSNGQFDPNDYEAEVIIHKPEPRRQPARAEVEAPVVRADAVRAEPRAPRIPGDLDRVQKADIPGFLGQKAATVQQSRAPKKGPTFFERLTGNRRKENEEPAPAPQPQRREPTVATRVAKPEPRIQSEARTPESLSSSTESRLVQPSYEEEQLEIPTFLRRQAN